MQANIAYKIVTKANWNEFLKKGIKNCKGFENDDKFIHMSTREQLGSTLAKKYSSMEKRNYNLLCVNLSPPSVVKWEKAKNGLTYPHLYSDLIIGENIVWVMCLEEYKFDEHGDGI